MSWLSFKTPKESSVSLWKSRLCAGLIFGMLGNAASAFATTTLKFPNPIAVDSFLGLVKAIANAVRDIAIPFAALAIIFVGFKFVAASAAGKPEQVAKARTLFLWVLIGTAIIVGASLLAEAVVNTIRGLS